MIASVNLKLSATEFDLVREALQAYRDDRISAGMDSTRYGHKERRDAKVKSLQLEDLLRKLA